MSEGEVAQLRRMITDLSEKSDRLSDKTDRQHAENQRSQQADREAFRLAITAQQTTFERAIQDQRSAFQEAINKQFLEHMTLSTKVDHGNTMLKLCIGDGQPGEGRLGALEETVETLKKFRWQALAIITSALYLADKILPTIGKH